MAKICSMCTCCNNYKRDGRKNGKPTWEDLHLLQSRGYPQENNTPYIRPYFVVEEEVALDCKRGDGNTRFFILSSRHFPFTTVAREIFRGIDCARVDHSTRWSLNVCFSLLLIFVDFFASCKSNLCELSSQG